jgi:hypothetical protein
MESLQKQKASHYIEALEPGVGLPAAGLEPAFAKAGKPAWTNVHKILGFI